MGGVINIILKTGRTAPGTLVEASDRLVVAVPGQGAERRHDRQVRLVCRRRGRLAPGLQQERRRHRAEHPLVALRRHRRLRHADRRGQPRRRHGPQRRRLRRRLPRLVRQRLRLRQPLQPVGRLHLQRQDAGRPRQRVRSRPTTCATSTTSTTPARSARSTRFGVAHLLSTTTAASSTSWARASSRATSCGRATSCCSASTGSAAGSAPTAIALDQRGREPALAAGQQPDRKRLRLLCRGCAALLRRPLDGARRRAPDLRQHGGSTGRRTPDPAARAATTTRRPPTRSARPSRPPDWLNSRVGASSGFRAPTATELGANFTVTPIGTTIFGNPNLQPETAHQIEAGATANWDGGRLDLAMFQNIISNRITATTISSVGGVVIQRSRTIPATSSCRASSSSSRPA